VKKYSQKSSHLYIETKSWWKWWPWHWRFLSSKVSGISTALRSHPSIAKWTNPFVFADLSNVWRSRRRLNGVSRLYRRWRCCRMESCCLTITVMTIEPSFRVVPLSTFRTHSLASTVKDGFVVFPVVGSLSILTHNFRMWSRGFFLRFSCIFVVWIVATSSFSCLFFEVKDVLIFLSEINKATPRIWKRKNVRKVTKCFVC